MMSRHFRLNSELSGAITKRPPHAKISFMCLAVSSIKFVRDTLPGQKYSTIPRKLQSKYSRPSIIRNSIIRHLDYPKCVRVPLILSNTFQSNL